MILDGVREYAEEYDVELTYDKKTSNNRFGSNRYIILAANEGGYNCTEVDFLDLIEWMRQGGVSIAEDEIQCLLKMVATKDRKRITSQGG